MADTNFLPRLAALPLPSRPDGLLGLADVPARPAWHSVHQDVYHDMRECTEGNNIEPWNVRPGTGNLRRCWRCSQISKEVEERAALVAALQRDLPRGVFR